MTRNRTNHRHPPAQRSAFTLIELLVVVAIIAVLVGLTGAALFKFIGTATAGSTENTLRKLNTEMDRHWKAVTDDAKEEFRTVKIVNGFPVPVATLVAVAGSQDAAQNLWISLRLQQEFPMSFKEATNPIVFSNSNGTITLKPKPDYLRALQGASSGTYDWEASVCLLMALNINRRGDDSKIENVLGNSAIKQVNNMRCVVDSYGTPIRFERGKNDQMPIAISAGQDKAHKTADDKSSATLR